MIRGLLSRVCSTAEQFLSSTPTPDEIRQIILEIYHSLSRLDAGKLSPIASQDLLLAEKYVARLNWIELKPGQTVEKLTDTRLLTRAQEWRASLPAGNVLETGRFAAGAGASLDVLDELGSASDRIFALAQAERLMRHVEVKRDRALSHSFPEVRPQFLTMEKCDVAILFARMAARHSDLRFLNTSFKLNDWSLRRFGRGANLSAEPRARFLLSLTEQEFAVGALL